MHDKLKRTKLFGIPVDVADTQKVLREVEAGLEQGAKQRTLLAINPEKIFSLEKDHELRSYFEKSDILIPDGIGIVKALQLLQGVRLSRLTGADLMEDICVLAARKGYRVFFFGSKEEVNAGATETLEKRYSGLQVAGRHNGYINESDMESLITQINDSKTDILFVALGSPRQEKWMQTYANRLDVGIMQGLGGTLDTITGHVLRAHPVAQALGLEWLSRLIREPHRIKRQAVLPKFVFRVLLAKLRIVPS